MGRLQTHPRTFHSYSITTWTQRQLGHVFGFEDVDSGQLGQYGFQKGYTQDDFRECSSRANPGHCCCVHCLTVCHWCWTNDERWLQYPTCMCRYCSRDVHGDSLMLCTWWVLISDLIIQYHTHSNSLSDFFLIAMVLLSMKFKMNPDNLATPLAASIGDIVSISVFSFIASFLYRHHGK